MSIIQQHTSASLSDAWRTINIDALQEDSSVNFDTSTLHPPLPEIGEAEVRALAGQVRQLLRGGDAEGALRGCLEMPVYNGNDLAKVRQCPEDPAWSLPSPRTSGRSGLLGKKGEPRAGRGHTPCGDGRGWDRTRGLLCC